MDSVKFLDHVISTERVMIDPHKVEAIMNWEAPINQTEVRSFYGLAEYYRRFIRNFSMIVSPMTHLLKKNVEFMWSVECQRSMKELKKRLTTTSVLMLPNDSSNFVVYSDASQKGIGCALIQNKRVVSYISDS